jgi:hypothetical protein
MMNVLYAIRMWLMVIFRMLPNAYNNEKPEEGFKEVFKCDLRTVASLPAHFNIGYPHLPLPEYQFRINGKCVGFGERGAQFILVRNPIGTTKPYDACTLHTKGTWKYPRIKAWLKLPEGKGHWASIFTYGNDGPPEVDIFEWCKQWGSRINMTMHKGYRDKIGIWSSKRNRLRVPGLTNGRLYCFEVELQPMRTIWRLNGIVTKVRKQSVDNQQRILIINVVSDRCGDNFVETEKKGMKLEKLVVLQK